MAKKKTKAGMTKAEAVRKAIADLGPDAKPTQLQGHIKRKYGIDMTAGHVKVERQKFFKKEAEKGEPVAAKPAVQPSPAAKTEPKKAPAGGITKAEAVRQAVADLGPDAGRTEMQGHIRRKYAIEMSLDHISVEKRKALKKAGKRKAAAKKPAAQPSAARTAEPKEPSPKTAAAPQANGNAIGLEDIEAAKGLVERVGADSLKKLIDVLAR